jgi:hypothetical protein
VRECLACVACVAAPRSLTSLSEHLGARQPQVCKDFFFQKKKKEKKGHVPRRSAASGIHHSLASPILIAQSHTQMPVRKARPNTRAVRRAVCNPRYEVSVRRAVHTRTRARAHTHTHLLHHYCEEERSAQQLLQQHSWACLLSSLDILVPNIRYFSTWIYRIAI